MGLSPNPSARGIHMLHNGTPQKVTWQHRRSHDNTEGHMTPQKVTWQHKRSHDNTEGHMTSHHTCKCARQQISHAGHTNKGRCCFASKSLWDLLLNIYHIHDLAAPPTSTPPIRARQTLSFTTYRPNTCGQKLATMELRPSSGVVTWEAQNCSNSDLWKTERVLDATWTILKCKKIKTLRTLWVNK